QWPEIYEMQVRAIARAAKAVQERGGDPPLVEIMHPLVGFREELRRLRELTERVRSEEHTSELQSLPTISYAVFCLKKKKPPPHIPSRQMPIKINKCLIQPPGY